MPEKASVHQTVNSLLDEVRSAGLGFRKIRILEVGVPEGRPADVGFTEIGALQICVPEIGILQPRFPEIHASQLTLGKDRLAKVGGGE